MKKLPSDQHITYQLQFRKCGKASCSTCRNGQGHGPYWYAYWREGPRLRSGYVGKNRPDAAAAVAAAAAFTSAAAASPA
jgi:hypothetical protein